jgi:Tfp pilus assembly protein PilO
MAHKIDETTEVRVSLKTLAVILIAVVSAAAFVFHMEERLDLLEHNTMMNKVNFENYREQPSRSHTDVEVLKKELEYLKQEIKELKGR